MHVECSAQFAFGSIPYPEHLVQAVDGALLRRAADADQRQDRLPVAGQGDDLVPEPVRIEAIVPVQRKKDQLVRSDSQRPDDLLPGVMRRRRDQHHARGKRVAVVHREAAAVLLVPDGGERVVRESALRVRLRDGPPETLPRVERSLVADVEQPPERKLADRCRGAVRKAHRQLDPQFGDGTCRRYGEVADAAGQP